MLHDAGSWHFEFNAVVRQVRDEILRLAGVSRDQGYEAILMQGSGTFGVESVLASAIPADGKLLVLANGAYGERIVQMARYMKLDHVVLRSTEHATPDLDALEQTLRNDSKITDVAMIHCETTTGILNPLEDVAHIVKSFGRRLIIDAMCSFGALPIDVRGSGIDFLITSPNKCMEGVPGFSIVIAKRESLQGAEHSARSLSLDLWAQLKSFETSGQFRFTPPTHAILAFAQALKELEAEGGPKARLARYQSNHETLLEGMKQMGFHSCLDPEVQSCIITSFFYPPDPHFVFVDFYHRLSDKGFIIYPGKITRVDCFRIGSIGQIRPDDVHALLKAIQETLDEMEVTKISRPAEEGIRRLMPVPHSL
jgi:2-aminoethylphosphonate-pyruvate transaminase